MRASAVMATGIIAMVAAAMAAPASGQTERQDFPAQRFRASEDGYGLLGVNGGGIPAHLGVDVGLTLDYANNPLVLRLDNERVGALVEHRVSAEVTAAIGLLDYLALEAAVPVALFQQRGATPGIDPDALQPILSAGLADARILAKLRVLREDRHFVSLSIAPTLTLPGSALQAAAFGAPPSYLGEPGPTLIPELALSSARIAGVVAAVNLGYRLRGRLTSLNIEVRDEILYRVGLGYDFGAMVPDLPLTVLTEIDGATVAAGPFEDFYKSPLEWRAGLRFLPVPDFQIYIAGGSGLVPGYGTPDFRVLAGIRYVAIGGDIDGDGVGDYEDSCPEEPEDDDGFEDSDGCPELDNDRDGVSDLTDRCPLEAEDRDGFQDDDGCPDTDDDGDGVLDVADNCREEAGPVDQQGCPTPDSDGDGVHDHRDRCPGPQEDLDGFKDDDGCPEFDNDQDGLKDAEDKCPDDAEDRDGFQDDDGCPELDNDGDTIPDAKDRCPDEAASPERVKQGMGCPPKDSDGDGLFDEEDRCPADAEDKDGFEDQDGCPDLDNDRDGVTDAKDKCPNEPETINGVKDADGCPDQGRTVVVLKKDKIEIKEKIFFKSGSAKIRRRSFKLLSQVAQLLRGHTEIKKLRIEGYTDDRGPAKRNKKLSRKRAEAVALFLVEAGVEPDRLRAVGYGEERPIADNKTRAGREQNRRVEFNIVAE